MGALPQAMQDDVPRGPGIAQVPGFFWGLARHADATFEDLFERYGDVAWVSFPKWMSGILPGGSRLAFVRDPTLIKPLFVAPTEVIDTAQANRGVEMFWGDRSLSLLDGPPHRRLRKVLLPRLRGEAMAQWREFIVAGAEREVRGWEDQPTITVYPRMLDLALELILKVTLSVSDSAMPHWKPAWRDLIKTAVSEQTPIRYALRGLGAVRLWPRFQRRMRKCNRLVFDEIARRRRHPEVEHEDLLDLLIRADGEPLSDKELRDQVFTILTAGYSTSATLASWAIERLVRHPGVLDAATAEARHGDGQTAYLDAVVQETLRLRPPIAYLGRLVRQPFTVGKHHFPVGTLVVPVVQSVHLQPGVYEDPQSFRPERFLQKRPDTYGHIPFGGGPHRCLGDRLAVFETTLVLATLLRRVNLAPVDPRDEPVRLKAGFYIPGHGARVCASRAA